MDPGTLRFVVLQLIVSMPKKRRPENRSPCVLFSENGGLQLFVR